MCDIYIAKFEEGNNTVNLKSYRSMAGNISERIRPGVCVHTYIHIHTYVNI